MKDNTDKKKGEPRWFKSYENDFENPEFQRLLTYCHQEKINAITAEGLVNRVKRHMVRKKDGRITEWEFENICATYLYGETYTEGKWREFLGMAIRYKVFEVEEETEADGTKHIFVLHSSVRNAIQRIDEDSQNKSKAGTASQEKQRLAQKKKDERNARRRARYREKKNQTVLEKSSQHDV